MGKPKSKPQIKPGFNAGQTEPKTQQAQANQHRKIAVIGAGAWGTTLALLFAQNGHRVSLWARRSEHAADMMLEGHNRQYLPDQMFPAHLHPTSNALEAIEGAELAVVAVPSKGLKETLQHMPIAPAYLSVTKGLRFSDHLVRMSEEIAAATGQRRVAALSGPNLAHEIAEGLPATTVVASSYADLASSVQGLLSNRNFRVYTSSDVLGVEIGGALKNVIALSVGMAQALGLGDNAKSALITRGLREIVRFGTAQGAHSDTFYGLSGLGDMIATCSSPASRNRSAGEHFAKGYTLAQLEAKQSVAEGVYTAKALHEWAVRSGVDLPITESVYKVVYQQASVADEIDNLMGRLTKPE